MLRISAGTTLALVLVAAGASAGDEPRALTKPLPLLEGSDVVELRVPARVPPGYPVPITLVNHSPRELSVYGRCAGDAVQDETDAFLEINDSHRFKKMAMPTDELAPGAAKQLCTWDQKVEREDGGKRIAVAAGTYRYVLTVEPRATDKAPLDVEGFPSATVEITKGKALELGQETVLELGQIAHVPDASLYLRLDDVLAATLAGGEHAFAAQLAVFGGGTSQSVGLSLDARGPQHAGADVGDFELRLRWVDAWQQPATASLIVTKRGAP